MAGGVSASKVGDLPPLHHPKTLFQPLLVGANQIQIPIFQANTKSTIAYSNHGDLSDNKEAQVKASKIAKIYSLVSNKNQLDHPSVIFKKQDKEGLVSRINNVVIAKFSHGKPSLKALKGFLLGMKLKGDFSISPFDFKHVFIVCKEFEDFVRIWLLQAWMINGFKARFFKWTEYFCPKIESRLAPVWVHLPGLPIYLFDEDALLYIASVFGRPLFIDPSNLDHSKVNCVSFCVEVDISLPFHEELRIEFEGEEIGSNEVIWQSIIYGSIPLFCSGCQHLGHILDACKCISQAVVDKRNGKRVAEGGVPVRIKSITDKEQSAVGVDKAHASEQNSDRHYRNMDVSSEEEEREIVREAGEVLREKLESEEGLEIKNGDLDVVLVEEVDSELSDSGPAFVGGKEAVSDVVRLQPPSPQDALDDALSGPLDRNTTATKEVQTSNASGDAHLVGFSQQVQHDVLRTTTSSPPAATVSDIPIQKESKQVDKIALDQTKRHNTLSWDESVEQGLEMDFSVPPFMIQGREKEDVSVRTEASKIEGSSHTAQDCIHNSAFNSLAKTLGNPVRVENSSNKSRNGRQKFGKAQCDFSVKDMDIKNLKNWFEDWDKSYKRNGKLVDFAIKGTRSKIIAGTHDKQAELPNEYHTSLASSQKPVQQKPKNNQITSDYNLRSVANTQARIDLSAKLSKENFKPP